MKRFFTLSFAELAFAGVFAQDCVAPNGSIGGTRVMVELTCGDGTVNIKDFTDLIDQLQNGIYSRRMKRNILNFK